MAIHLVVDIEDGNDTPEYFGVGVDRSRKVAIQTNEISVLKTRPYPRVTVTEKVRPYGEIPYTFDVTIMPAKLEFSGGFGEPTATAVNMKRMSKAYTDGALMRLSGNPALDLLNVNLSTTYFQIVPESLAIEVVETYAGQPVEWTYKMMLEEVRRHE